MHLLTELLDVLRKLVVAEAYTAKVHLADMVKAEGQALRAWVYRAVVACLVAVLAFAGFAAALALTLCGVFLLLAPVTGPAAAALLIAAIFAVAAVNLLLLARWMLRERD